VRQRRASWQLFELGQGALKPLALIQKPEQQRIANHGQIAHHDHGSVRCTGQREALLASESAAKRLPFTGWGTTNRAPLAGRESGAVARDHARAGRASWPAASTTGMAVADCLSALASLAARSSRSRGSPRPPMPEPNRRNQTEHPSDR
jgi:hypothetical protein